MEVQDQPPAEISGRGKNSERKVRRQILLSVLEYSCSWLFDVNIQERQAENLSSMMFQMQLEEAVLYVK